MTYTNIPTTNLAKRKLEITSIKPIKLSYDETQKIEETSENVKYFRQLGERIKAPIDNIIKKTAKIIEGNPITNISIELTEINKQVQSVYREIINNDGPIMKFIKSLPLVGNLAEK